MFDLGILDRNYIIKDKALLVIWIGKSSNKNDKLFLLFSAKPRWWNETCEEPIKNVHK